MSLQARYRAYTLKRRGTQTYITDTPAFETVGTYRGLIQPTGAGESQQFGNLQESYTHLLFTDVSAPIQFGDRIEQDGVPWRVVSSVQPQGVTGIKVHHKEIALAYVGEEQ